jgi:hypothetical protein
LTNFEIIEDMLKQHPNFFERYENLAQQYYKLVEGDGYPIPRAHCNALLELLTQSGYRLTKVEVYDNVTVLTPNVLGFRKKVT